MSILLDSVMEISRCDILARYTVRDGTILDGVFQGAKIYVPYFWEAYLSGNAHDVSDDHVVLFAIHSEDLREFPELKNRSVIKLRQRPDGKIEEV